MPESAVRHFRWTDMPEERVTDTISRKYCKRVALSNLPVAAAHSQQT